MMTITKKEKEIKELVRNLLEDDNRIAANTYFPVDEFFEGLIGYFDDTYNFIRSVLKDVSLRIAFATGNSLYYRIWLRPINSESDKVSFENVFGYLLDANNNDVVSFMNNLSDIMYRNNPDSSLTLEQYAENIQNELSFIRRETLLQIMSLGREVIDEVNAKNRKSVNHLLTSIKSEFIDKYGNEAEFVDIENDYHTIVEIINNFFYKVEEEYDEVYLTRKIDDEEILYSELIDAIFEKNGLSALEQIEDIFVEMYDYDVSFRDVMCIFDVMEAFIKYSEELLIERIKEIESEEE